MILYQGRIDLKIAFPQYPNPWQGFDVRKSDKGILFEGKIKIMVPSLKL